MSHFFALCASNKTHGHARIARETLYVTQFKFSTGLVQVTHTLRTRIVPSATTSIAYILCFRQVDLSIWAVIDRILVVLLVMGRSVTRILDDVTRTLDSYT